MRTAHSADVHRSDELLERDFARGDASAFERAYAVYFPRMYGCALRILGNDAVARECVHDVILHLWRRAGGGYTADRGSLEAFLLVCVRNAALAHVRNTGRRAELEADDRPPTQWTDPDPLEHEHVAHAVAALPPEQSRVISLAYYQGMTHVEIARELHEPLGTIKSRLSSGLRALRTMLAKDAVR